MTARHDSASPLYRLSDFGPQLTWRTLYGILLLLTLGLLASLVLNELQIALRLALTLLLFLVGTTLVYAAMKRQKNRLANQLIIGTVWFATLLQIIYTGTFHRGQGAFFIVVLLLATILLGRTGTLVVGAMSVAGLIIGFHWRQDDMVAWNGSTSNSLTMDYFTLLILFAMMVYIVQYVVHMMQRTFAGAQLQQQIMLQEQGRLTEQILMRRQTEFFLQAANAELQASQKVLEERVQQRTAELAQANQDLETLLYVTSHDLREPLRAIQNFSQLVLRRYQAELGATGCNSLEEVTRSANQLDSVIEEILLLSRAQRQVAPAATVPAKAMVQEAIQRLETQVDLTTVTLSVADELPLLFADAQWLVEGLFHLLRSILLMTRAEEMVHIMIDGGEGPAGPQLVIQLAELTMTASRHQALLQLVGQAGSDQSTRIGSRLTLIDQIMQKHNGSAYLQPGERGSLAIVLTFGLTEDRVAEAVPF